MAKTRERKTRFFSVWTDWTDNSERKVEEHRRRVLRLCVGLGIEYLYELRTKNYFSVYLLCTNTQHCTCI